MIKYLKYNLISII